MTIDEAIEVLELHNQWRKGADIPMETPVRIGMAIDLVVCELKNLRIAHVMQRSEQLISLLEKLLENNMCSHAGDELIEQMLKEINCA